MIERKFYQSFADLLKDIDNMNVGLDLKKTFSLPPYFLADKTGAIYPSSNLNGFIYNMISILNLDMLPWSGIEGTPMSIVYHDYNACFKPKQEENKIIEVVEKVLEEPVVTDEIEIPIFEEVKEEPTVKLIQEMTAKEIRDLLASKGITPPRIMNKAQLIEFARTSMGDIDGNTGSD